MQVLGNPQSSVSGSFAGAPAGIAPFTLTNRVDRTFLKLTPSLTVSHANSLDVRVGASYAVSAGSRGFNAFLQIGKRL
jgi:hypothetical protein